MDRHAVDTLWNIAVEMRQLHDTLTLLALEGEAVYARPLLDKWREAILHLLCEQTRRHQD